MSYSPTEITIPAHVTPVLREVSFLAREIAERSGKILDTAIGGFGYTPGYLDTHDVRMLQAYLSQAAADLQEAIDTHATAELAALISE